jgi:hypothetical protein
MLSFVVLAGLLATPFAAAAQEVRNPAPQAKEDTDTDYCFPNRAPQRGATKGRRPTPQCNLVNDDRRDRSLQMLEASRPVYTSYNRNEPPR